MKKFMSEHLRVPWYLAEGEPQKAISRCTERVKQDYGVNEYLALVDFSIFPHLDSPEFIRNRIEIIDKATIDFRYPVYAIQDTQAVVVDSGVVSFVGGDAS